MSTDKDQWEASRTIRFKFDLTTRVIILPQVVPVIVPHLGNQFIAMLKDCSLVSVLGVCKSRNRDINTLPHYHANNNG